ncbi:MAG TPA: hypothetical protein VHC67_11190 [Gaiellaceae bacterium]|jgi:hypothetical protein|nr:hypothetical protein [Gaiellaceae bacterium]
MSSATRGAVFDPLVAIAKARIVALVDRGALPSDDGEFLLRALIDLESDGVELFGRHLPADTAFYNSIVEYLEARVGPVAAEAPVLAPGEAETFAVLGEPAPYGPDLDRAVLKLISHQGGRA